MAFSFSKMFNRTEEIAVDIDKEVVGWLTAAERGVHVPAVVEAVKVLIKALDNFPAHVNVVGHDGGEIEPSYVTITTTVPAKPPAATVAPVPAAPAAPVAPPEEASAPEAPVATPPEVTPEAPVEAPVEASVATEAPVPAVA